MNFKKALPVLPLLTLGLVVTLKEFVFIFLAALLVRSFLFIHRRVTRLESPKSSSSVKSDVVERWKAMKILKSIAKFR